VVGILQEGLQAPHGRRVRWNLTEMSSQATNTITTGEEDGEEDREDDIRIDREEDTTEPSTAKDRGEILKLASLNIVDGRSGGLYAAIRCMRDMNIDMALFTETKLATDKHTKHFMGYDVVATTAHGRKGGVALVYRKTKAWGLESTRVFGPNVILTTLVSGQLRWHIIGGYIPPSETDGSTLAHIERAWDTCGNSRWPVIMLGDLNVDLENPDGTYHDGAERRQETAALLETMGLKDMRKSFRQRKKILGRYWTYRKKTRGVVHGSICDYILSTSRKFFTNCQIKTPRYNTDHNILVATLRLGSVKNHQRYVRSRGVYPIKRLAPLEGNRADGLLDDLREATEKRRPVDYEKRQSWITDLTWRLIDQKSAARRNGETAILRVLKRKVQRSLKKDRAARAALAGNIAKLHLEQGNIREAFGAIKGWYRSAGPRPHKPSREDINLTRAEYANLFDEALPSEDEIPLHAPQFDIDDTPPTEGEVVTQMKKLRNNKAAGATGITAEHLKDWFDRANPTEEGVDPDPKAEVLWAKVLEIIRLAFEEGEVPREFSQGIFVLIPKGITGEYRGIALLEIIYKLISSIINQRMSDKIELADELHGFRQGRGTGTAIMEAKLLSQLQCRSDEPLYMIFLDLKKAYDTLDRKQAMRILEAYGVGCNLRRIISKIWEGDTMVPRQAGYFGKPFRAKRGVRQGDIISPLIFNIMVDAVVRHWRHTMRPDGTQEMAVFYADDGLLTGIDPGRVQESMDMITKGFASLGLKMNALKTETMTMVGGQQRKKWTTAAYKRQVTGEGLSYAEKRKTKQQCIKCGALLAWGTVPRHQQNSRQCKVARRTYQPPTPVRNRVAEEQALTPGREPESFTFSIPKGLMEEIPCPIEGCDFKVKTDHRGSKRTAICRHFRHRHIEDTVIIAEEPRQRCIRCGLFMINPHRVSHTGSLECAEFAEKQRNFYKAKSQCLATEVRFWVNGQEIKKVPQFKYLGRLLDERDDDAHAALLQLHRAREKWTRIGNVLRTDGASARTMGYFYKAIVQAVLLYGSESWTITTSIMQKIKSFHARVARSLTGRHIKQRPDGTWDCPPTTEVLEGAGLETIEEYIIRRRHTVRRFVRHRPLYEVCRRSRALGGNTKKVVWWKLD